MSNPPPPYGGQSPYGAPQQPGPPPGYGVPGGLPPYQHPPQPPPSGNGGKIALIVIGIIGLVAVLFCGGVIALIYWFASAVGDAIDSAIPDRDRPGGPDNPRIVAVGQAFEIDDLEYGDGWALVESPTGHRTNIEGLRAENVGSTGRRVNIDFTFVAADETIGRIWCSHDNVRPGAAAVVSCNGTPDSLEGFDTIEVATRW